MSGHRLSVRPYEIRGLSRREREILEGAVRLVSEQAKAANVIIEEALETGLHGSDPIPIHAKALRIELLRLKANLERELESFVLDCSECGRPVHLVSRFGVSPGYWAHREPSPHHEPAI